MTEKKYYRSKRPKDPVFEAKVDKKVPARIGYIAFDFSSGPEIEIYYNVFTDKSGKEFRKEQLFDLNNLKQMKRSVYNADVILDQLVEYGDDFINVFPVWGEGKDKILPLIDQICKLAGYRVTDFSEEVKKFYDLGGKQSEGHLLNFKLVRLSNPVRRTVKKLSNQKMKKIIK
jgi:hypothetical protein